MEFISGKVILWQGYLLVISGAVLQALSIILMKKVVDGKSQVKDTSPDAASAINFFGSGIIMFIACFMFNPPDIKSWFSPTGLIWPLMGTSLLNILNLYGIGRSLKGADVSLIAPISALGPIMTIIPSWFFLREAPTTFGYFGVIAIFLGVYAMAFAEKNKIKIDTVPTWLKTMDGYPRLLAPIVMLFYGNKQAVIAAVGAACGAVSVNFDKLSAMRSSPLFLSGFVFTFLGIIGLIKTLKTGELREVNRVHIFNLTLLIVITAIRVPFYNLAFYYGLAIYVTSLKRTSIIFILVLSYIFLGEKKELKPRLPGIFFIVLGVVLLGF